MRYVVNQRIRECDCKLIKICATEKKEKNTRHGTSFSGVSGFGERVRLLEFEYRRSNTEPGDTPKLASARFVTLFDLNLPFARFSGIGLCLAY